MKKRILSVFMALCMVLSLAPMTAWAAEASPNITLTVAGSLNGYMFQFDSAEEGYGAQEGATVKVKNTGDAETGALTVSIAGTNTAAFELSTNAIENILAGGETTFTVTPTVGLSAGEYTAQVLVCGNGLEQFFDFVFTVNAASVTPPTTPAETYSIFDAKIPFVNVVDCQRSVKTESGVKTQYVHGFDYVCSDMRRVDGSNRVDKLVPDVVQNPENYYYKFTKGENGEIGLALHGNGGSTEILAEDGSITYGDNCFLYVSKKGAYGTFVSFKEVNIEEKAYHLCGESGCGSHSYGNAGCTSCGCGDRFVVQESGTYDLENLPFVDGLVELETFYLGVQGTYTFPEAIVGYEQPAAKTVTVTNNGDAIEEALYVSLYYLDSDSTPTEFVLGGLDGDNLNGIGADSIETFTIRPAAGLPAGIYTANVVVSNGRGDISESFKVSFTVTDGGSAPTPAYGISVSKRGSFNEVAEGYTQSSAGTVSVDVVNTGDIATGQLTVTKTGDVDAFVNSVTTIDSIAVGGDDGIFIGAKEGLSAGTYTMTVKIGNDTVGYKEVTLSFTVTEAPSADPTPTPSTGSSKKPTYPAKLVKDADVENGSISFSKTRAKAGRTVTITVTPDAGFALDKLVIRDDDGKTVDFKDNGDGTYTFTMPKGGVEVEPFFVQAAPEKEPVTLVLFIDQKAYLLDNEPLVNDVAPVVQAERTTLPIRLVAETLGAEVDWNEAEQTVTITKRDISIVIYIGQGFALVNGAPVELDCPAFIANSRTYLPVRFVAENLDAKVTWGGADGSVTIVVE